MKCDVLLPMLAAVVLAAPTADATSPLPNRRAEAVAAALDRAVTERPAGPLAADLELADSRWDALVEDSVTPFASDSGRHIVVHLNTGVLVAEEDGIEQLRLPVAIGRADPLHATPATSARVHSVVRDASGGVRFVLSRGCVQSPRGIELSFVPAAPPIDSTTPIASRARTDGAVQLADGVALARWVLGSRWPSKASRGVETLVPTRPVAVHLLYQTLTVDDAGQVARYPDIYALDPAARAASALRTAMDGTQRRLAVVTFVADWCVACKRMAPELAALVDRQRRSGVDLALLGLAIDGPPRATWPFPVHGAPADVTAGDSRFGAIDLVPTTWLVSRTGVPLYRYEGAGHEALEALNEDLTGYVAAEARLEAAETGTTP